MALYITSYAYRCRYLILEYSRHRDGSPTAPRDRAETTLKSSEEERTA
jgi:hypothetical protein